MIFSRRAFLLLLPAVFLLTAAACVPASKGALEQTQTQLAALQQRVETLNKDLESVKASLPQVQGDVKTLKDGLAATQNDVTTLKGSLVTAQGDVAALKGGLATAQGDVAKMKDGLTTTQGDVSTLKGGLATASSDLAKAKTDITATSNSLSDLKNSYLLSRQDLDKLGTAQATTTSDLAKLQAAQAKDEKLAKLELVAHLYYMTWSYDSGQAILDSMQSVAEAARATGDAELQSAWATIDTALKVYAGALGTTREADATKALARAHDAFLTLLTKKLVAAQK